MAATPSNNRLKLTPSNSPFFARSARSPFRGRTSHESRLSLKRVVGTTCSSPTGFDTVNSSFSYIAGGAVVVVDVDGEHYTQRFFRARPTAVPIYATSSQNAPSTPTATPKANDSRGRAALRDSPYGSGSTPDWSDSPSSRTWTSRERIKAATCLSLSPDGKYLAVGETGYAPRVLTFSLLDASSDTPLVSISEHTFGVRAVAWSPDSKLLASLGMANDGCLYIWKIDQRNGAAKLFQQNRCTSYVRDMVWLGNTLVTLGVRHIKMWKVEEAPAVSPTKPKFANDSTLSAPMAQKTLPGRNVLLGTLLEATFCTAAVDGNRLLICTEAGDVCIVEDDDRQMKLLKVVNLGFSITAIIIRNNMAHVGGKDGQFATLDMKLVMDGQSSCVISTAQPSSGVLAMGFLTQKLVTIDSERSIDIWNPDHLPGQAIDGESRITIPGHGGSITGIHSLEKPNRMDASFLTWSTTGTVAFWDLEGLIKCSVNVAVEGSEMDTESTHANQMTCARTSRYGKLLVTADRQGVLKITDMATRECLLDTKAHSSDCLGISLYEDDTKFLLASCGRDRSAQLFHRKSNGDIEHFQTIDYNAKVVQVIIPTDDRVITCSTDRTLQIHDLVGKEGDPDAVAAIPSRVVTLKASPTSMAMGQDGNTVFVSFLDRSVCQFDINSGRQVSNFKCIDEGGSESAVMESLSLGHWAQKDMDFLLGTSNTDKSIRLYDANAGRFLDREWGHTEAINGVSLINEEDGGKKVVSVGSDATIMIWGLDLNDPSPRSMSRDPSPVKDAAPNRPTLRRVLSRAELAEFQRPMSQNSRNPSPPRTLRRRTSRLTLTANIFKTPTNASQTSPSSAKIAEGTPSRQPSVDCRDTSPPASPKSKATRRPSLPALGGPSLRKTSSSSSLRSFGSLNMSTEQTCRTLRAYRKKLASAEPLGQEVLAELDQELRLTAAALGDRAVRSKAMDETAVSGLLDQYSERLVTLLDEKMRLSYQPRREGELSREVDGPGSPNDDSTSSSL